MLWLPAPRQFPNVCALTGLSGREHGPYLEIDSAPGRPYIDPRTRKEGRMYISFSAWRPSVIHPDSPYLTILNEAVEKRTEELTARIKQLEAQLAADPAQTIIESFNRKLAAMEPQMAAAPAGGDGVEKQPERQPHQRQRPRR